MAASEGYFIQRVKLLFLGLWKNSKYDVAPDNVTYDIIKCHIVANTRIGLGLCTFLADV